MNAHIFVKSLNHNINTLQDSIAGGQAWKNTYGESKILLDLTTGGQALEKAYDDLSSPLNRIVQGNSDWHGNATRDSVKKHAGMLEVDII